MVLPMLDGPHYRAHLRVCHGRKAILRDGDQLPPQAVQLAQYHRLQRTHIPGWRRRATGYNQASWLLPLSMQSAPAQGSHTDCTAD